MDFPSSVAPFILRGVTLAGIDSVYFPASNRAAVWERLAADLTPEVTDDIAAVVSLAEVIPSAHQLLAGKLSGRVVVDLREGRPALG
jgi:acrylyl-CoA reductase (NADPH)